VDLRADTTDDGAAATRDGRLLRASAITRSYGRRQVLRGVDLTLDRGEIVALLGPNGSGKTTLMKVIVGLLDPAAGTVDGPGGNAVGWVPQGGATYQRLTVRENLELFARLLRLPGDAAHEAKSAARAADLDGWFETQGADLSGGLRQRLNVSVGLLGDPELLVLDEPTTGVDLVHRTAMFRVLRERAAQGCGVLYSTHSLEDAASADRIVVVVEGRVVYSGELEGIADAAATESGHIAGLDPISAGLLRLWGETAEGSE
jgi:ABC-2 type transport system ATP-binding protein